MEVLAKGLPDLDYLIKHPELIFTLLCMLGSPSLLIGLFAHEKLKRRSRNHQD